MRFLKDSKKTKKPFMSTYRIPITVSSSTRAQRRPSGFGATFIQKAWTKSTAVTGNPSGSGDKFATFTFYLTDITDYSSWTSTFDQYRFRKITALIQGTNQPASGSSVTIQPIVSVIDYDDNVDLPGYVQGLNYGSAMVHNGQCNDRRTFIPHSSTASIIGGSAVTTGNMKNMWVDCAQPALAHYGFKIAIAPSTTTNIFGWHVIFQYEIEFKNNR